MSDFLQERLDGIRAAGLYRELPGTVEGVDFWSNDYLGLAKIEHLRKENLVSGGATGSRLISGDRDLWHEVEQIVATFHGFAAGLVFNSGYTALVSLLSALLKRGDTIIYDELSHACCRDGIRLGFATALRFRHNDTLHLRQRLKGVRGSGQIFVLTEGRFSMDGDRAPLSAIADLCDEYRAQLIVDEAHTGGLEGERGVGLVAELNLTDRVLADVITFGKAFGTHGAVVLGGDRLKQYLVNTARPFIYTTGMSASQFAEIGLAYRKLWQHHSKESETLRYRIRYFAQRVKELRLQAIIHTQDGPIQTVRIPGNDRVLAAEAACRAASLLVKAIRSPTVPAGTERLRICLHSFNTEAEIDLLVTTLRDALATFAEN